MRSFVVVVLIAAVACLAEANWSGMHCKGPDGKEKPECEQHRKNEETCRTEAGVSEEEARNYHMCNIPDDAAGKEKMEKFSLCTFTKLGVLKEDGTQIGEMEKKCEDQGESTTEGSKGRKHMKKFWCDAANATKTCWTKKQKEHSDTPEGRALAYKLCWCESFSNPEFKKMRENEETCRNETDTSREESKKFHWCEIPDDAAGKEKMGKFSLCTLRKLETLKEDGTPNEEMDKKCEAEANGTANAESNNGTGRPNHWNKKGFWCKTTKDAKSCWDDKKKEQADTPEGRAMAYKLCLCDSFKQWGGKHHKGGWGGKGGRHGKGGKGMKNATDDGQE